MFKSKFIMSITIFISFLVLTSVIKNKTRVIEKEIVKINNKILSKNKDINETQLEFYYLTSPVEIEKKLSLLGFNKYQPIKHSNIFLKISEFNSIQNQFSNLKILDEKKIKKK